jgi:phosphatidate cytidylyltransferase
MDVNGAMALLEAKPRATAVMVRIASAAVLIPPVIAAVILGTPYFEALLIVCAVIVAWEWWRLCDARVGWLAVGVVYIGVPCLMLIHLRSVPNLGAETVLWLFVLVWAADTGAYAFGSTIGGPKLAPVISPNKTWAGLAGAIICSGLAGLVVARTLEIDSLLRLTILSGAVGLVAQAGDLAESWFKRRFGKKDAGGIIPGHGGLLDRVDGLLTASATAGALSLSRGGEIL